MGADSLTRLLWNNGNSTYSLWRINADASLTSFTYGPFSGWAATSVALGADSIPRILWNKSDGTAALYKVTEATGAFTSMVFGPYAGWTAKALAVGSDNTPRILWNKSDGTMSLYKVNTNGTFTAPTFGPYTGYAASFLAVGPDNHPRILWLNTGSGTVSLWTNADLSTAANIYSSVSGGTPLAMTVDTGNAPRILWNHPADSTVLLWTVATNGTYTSQTFSYPAGFTPQGLSAAPGGAVNILWTAPDGTVQIGMIGADGSITTTANLAPGAAQNPPPTHGDYWKFTSTGQGSYTQTSSFPNPAYPYPLATWTPPAAQVGGFSLYSTFGGSTPYYSAVNATATIAVQVTATWVPATGQTMTSDPPPPTVWLCENGRTDWSLTEAPVVATGSCNDGLGPEDVESSSSGLAASSNAPPTLPPAYWTNVTVVNGVATLPKRTLTATVNTTQSQAGYFAVHVDNYSVSVHPQPYNFKRVVGGGVIGLDGTLSFTYDWLSTSGSKDDLTSCFWHEYVTYPGPIGTIANPNKYYPSNPPFAFIPGVSWLNNPDVNPAPPSLGGAMTGLNKVADTQYVPPLVDSALYTYGIFTATQVYQFNDTATGESNKQIPGPDSGPFSIVREFKIYDTHDYRYTVTKDGKMSFVLKPF